MRLTSCFPDQARDGAPAPAAVDLKAVIDRLLGLFAGVVPKGVNVLVDVDADLPPVVGAASELEQLVLNLLVNACEAMPDGGELRMSVRAAGSSAICLAVADTGPGTSTTPERGGLGLGLGIVRSVAYAHRGGVHVTRRPGGGTIVRVTFPRRAA